METLVMPERSVKAGPSGTTTSPRADSEPTHIGRLTPAASRRARQRREVTEATRPSAAIVAEKELLRAIGRRYVECTLENYMIDTTLQPVDQDRQQRAVREIRGFVDELPTQIDAGRNLILFGTVGTGKDHLMAVACKAAAAADKTVRWRNASDVFTDAKATWGKRGESVDDILKPLQQADILALSDPIPAVGDIDAHEIRWLLSLIDKRYRDMKPTWVTLNAKDGADARRALSHQVIDRLQHNALVIDMKWNSYRVKR
jgi:DNA replication protein DnaC